MRSFILLSIFIGLVSLSGVAQKKNGEWQFGYFAPYLTHVGGTAAFAFDLNVLGGDSNVKSKSEHFLQISSQLGYFTQSKVSQNILLNPELVYRWKKSGKRFFLSSSVGTGYLLSFQRQDGVLNLGTGEIDYRYDALNYFLPNINLGLGLEPKKHLGFYLKATYGRKISVHNANAAFVGVSAGIILKFTLKD